MTSLARRVTRPIREFGCGAEKVTLGPVTDDELGQLMRAAQAGDAVAYGDLLQAIAPRVRRIVASRRHYAGVQEVEDLTQDVLLSVHAVRATYDPSRPFGPWLMAIIRNRMADGARRHARRAQEITVDNLDVTFADPTTNTRNETYGDPEELLQAIRGLPHGQRQAVELMKLKGMSLKEAAVATGLSIAALKVATHRAMASLRRALVKTDDINH
jgi:RNA polymerase sigma-70 factor (ECF subfamily)